MSDNRKLENGLVGVSGEYYVAAELSARGQIASITLRNTRGVDILTSRGDASETLSIQVKTNTGGKPIWLLNKKAETFATPTHFYVFVLLKDIGVRPSFYVVPSSIVAEQTSYSHANWLSGTKRDGSSRKDSSMRKFQDFENTYLEKWSVLGL